MQQTRWTPEAKQNKYDMKYQTSLISSKPKDIWNCQKSRKPCWAGYTLRSHSWNLCVETAKSTTMKMGSSPKIWSAPETVSHVTKGHPVFWIFHRIYIADPDYWKESTKLCKRDQGGVKGSSSKYSLSSYHLWELILTNMQMK